MFYVKEPPKKIKKYRYRKREHIHKPCIWENIFLQNIKKTPNSTIKKDKKYPIRKWAKDVHRHFTKEDMQKAKKHMADVILLPLKTYCFTNNKISLHTYLSKCLKLKVMPTTLMIMHKNYITYALLVEIQNGYIYSRKSGYIYSRKECRRFLKLYMYLPYDQKLILGLFFSVK